MEEFTYTATKDGKTITGTVSGNSKEAVINSLKKQSLHPIIVKKKKSKNGFNIKLGQKVGLKDLAVFTRQLSTMVSAGVPLSRALATLQAQASNKYFKDVIGDIGKNVEGGLPLSDGFAKYPNIFSEVYVSMVRAGEAGGILEDILKRLASQIERDSSMRKKIKSAMTYPVVILVVTVISFFGIMILIIPKISKILTDLGGEDAELPIYTRAMLSISDFVRTQAPLIIIVSIICVIIVRRYIKTPKGKYKFHALLLRLPIINTIIIKVAIARFARTFASLMSAGVGVLDALEVTGAAIGNKVFQRELEEASKEVKNGKQLSESLTKNTHFPPIVSQMLAVGEETGQIDTILVKVADFYEEEVATTIDGLSSIIEPIMIIVLGSVVGLIAASVMGPIASLSKNIGN
ncbi:MAG: type II secretion system F family protein [Candidatus Nomurabacteria bacterium]|nr:MAG: type II secretion system F family protein [Candidatus Nomurabacteria bacterium]